MWPFNLFKTPKKAAYPENLWTIETDDLALKCTDQTGKILSLAFTDLAAVAIETNDSGPWGADVWWLLFDKSENLGCAFPQGAKGEDQAVNRLTSLPGFDHQKMIEAMGSTDNA